MPPLDWRIRLPKRSHRFVAFAVVCHLGLCLAATHAAEKSTTYQAALASITAENLGHRVADLAGDAMEGREAGARGGLAASKYLADLWTRIHLQPAGDNNGYLQPFAPNFRNILGMLPGSDPKLRDEVILVGAHYDHVGYGGRGLSLGPYGYIHPGADDNASGTSAVVKLAEAFTMLAPSPKRSILFVCWDAEEKGLLGSRYWTAHPTIPLNRVVAAVNLDMIGRLREDRLTVMGSRTGYGWRRLLSSQNDAFGLTMLFFWDLKPVANHYPLFDHGIPVIMLHTGLHANYHRPTDTADRINNAGLMRVTRLAFGFIYELADRPQPAPAYRSAARHENSKQQQALLGESGKPADRLGVGWIEDPAEVGGALLSSIAPHSPAQKAGLRVGDCITRFAGRAIRNDDDFFAAVSGADSPAAAIVRRPGEEKPLELSVALDGAPLRWGISWCVDDAEPGTIILSHIVPGSPAAVAGLQIGDRIYQIDGRDFSDEAAFVGLAHSRMGPRSLVVERNGQLRTVTLQLQQAAPLKRAA